MSHKLNIFKQWNWRIINLKNIFCAENWIMNLLCVLANSFSTLSKHDLKSQWTYHISASYTYWNITSNSTIWQTKLKNNRPILLLFLSNSHYSLFLDNSKSVDNSCGGWRCEECDKHWHDDSNIMLPELDRLKCVGVLLSG